MQITSRFTVAIQIMLCVAFFQDTKKVTSEFLALSTNSNPAVIRKILGQLKTRDLVRVKAGVGGAELAKPLNETSLLDIFLAVDAVGDNFFSFHDNPNCDCPVGKNIHTVLDSHLYEIQQAMYDKMSMIKLDYLLNETQEFLEQ